MALRVVLDGSDVTAWGANLDEFDVEFDENMPPNTPNPDGLGWTVTGTTGSRVLKAPDGTVYAEESTAAASPAVATTAYVDARTGGVDVQLGAPGNFDIVLTPDTINAGVVTFRVTNADEAAITHEFLLIKTDTSAADWIAAAPVGDVVDETGLDIRVDTGEMAQGDTMTVGVLVEDGHYLAVCNEPGHSENGMAADFTVAAIGGVVTVGGSSSFLAATVPLSSADILALHTTPVTLVAGVADTIIQPLLIIGVLTPGANDYTANGLLRLFNGVSWAAADNGVSNIEDQWMTVGVKHYSGLFIQGGTPLESMLPNAYFTQAAGAVTGNLVGAPLSLDADAAFADGDGTVAFTTYYVLLPV